MRRQWKRNAVVATVLLFVCAAVYLNWRYAGEAAVDQAAGGIRKPAGGQRQHQGPGGCGFGRR